MSLAPTFSGEVQLAGWSDSHSGGAKIVLWLPERSQLDVFAGLTARKGNTAGHRFMCVLVEIGEDEQPRSPEDQWTIEDEKRAKAASLGKAVPAARTDLPPPSPAGGPLAQLAGRWCNDPEFQRWLWLNPAFTDYVQNAPEDLDEAGLAAHVVRRVCGVESRARLDHNPRAAEKFHRQIRIPYMKHVEVVGPTPRP